jgi:hypothetical protein
MKVRTEKLGAVFFLAIFGIISMRLIVIPSYKMSGYVPSLNKKIETILNCSVKPIIKVTSIGFWDSDITSVNLPLIVDNEIIKIISEITTNKMIKDGYRKEIETKYGNLEISLDNNEYLFVHFAWDNIREIMELRFDDTKGNTKRRFYKISNELAEKTFSLMI